MHLTEKVYFIIYLKPYLNMIDLQHILNFIEFDKNHLKFLSNLESQELIFNNNYSQPQFFNTTNWSELKLKIYPLLQEFYLNNNKNFYTYEITPEIIYKNLENIQSYLPNNSHILLNYCKNNYNEMETFLKRFFLLFPPFDNTNIKQIVLFYASGYFRFRWSGASGPGGSGLL